jgi:adenosylmethionine-8-amino-7-oxononanoate aminotransferase
MRKNVIWRPYTQEKTTPAAVKVVRAQGAHLFTKNGQKIFDGISSWWLTTHGHCHPSIVEAIQRQAAEIDQVTFANFSHQPAEELAELLIGITPPELTRVFFSDNGSTAVEVALKMTLQACQQKGLSEKSRFLAFASSYHGDTVGAMSVSGASPFNQPYTKTLFDVIRAKHPSTTAASVQDYVADFERLIEVHHRSLAAVIIEPLIQGAGGMIVWPAQAVQHIAKLCRSYEVYLIFDEVMTGFGRTGEMFAMNRAEVTPDILCLSKGLTAGSLPLATTIVCEELYQCFLSTTKGRMLFHGHSFTGNPISCAAAVASIKLFKEEQTLEKLKRIEADHQRNVETAKTVLMNTEFRVCGTMAAIELTGLFNGYLSEKLAALHEACLTKGLFVRPLGNVVYLLPPYCATKQELDDAWQILISEVQNVTLSQG